MILRCAACISSGSAFAIAFKAAARSPLLMASSTVRTAPRIWVRRDLLMMVRRAILRVAFLAEVVLAMFSNILRRWPLVKWSGLSAPAVQPHDRRWCFIRVFCENAIVGAYRLTRRRHSKNSGGGIAPAANGGLIEGAPCSVNAFRPPRNPGPGSKRLIRC